MKEPQSPSNLPVFTVGELSGAVKNVIENSFSYIRVRGEISGLKAAPSGHVYLTLKDNDAVIAAVCWRGVAQRFAFKPEDGLEVLCTGKLTTYGGKSQYQLVIDWMEPAGEGALMALLEKRKQQLKAEGLFDPARKKPIPFLPTTIGVITSPTGAVIRDILHRVRERFPRHVLLWPTPVQGEGSAEKIAAAIRGFNALPSSINRPDVIIIARGGGSIEDLWAFNEEIVVRAVAASSIPIISAVGHETDTTLIDFAADIRAPTPTAAAEIATPVRADLKIKIERLHHALTHTLARFFELYTHRVHALARAIPSTEMLLSAAQQRLDYALLKLNHALPSLVRINDQRLLRIASALRLPMLLNDIEQKHERLTPLHQRMKQSLERIFADKMRLIAEQTRLLESFHYQKILERGFALVRDEKNRLITSTQNLKSATPYTLEFHDGTAPILRSSAQQKKKTQNSSPSLFPLLTSPSPLEGEGRGEGEEGSTVSDA